MACHGGDGDFGLVYRLATTASPHACILGFILSNALWIVWGWHTQAFALIVLEGILLGMNARGFRKNQRSRNAG